MATLNASLRSAILLASSALLCGIGGHCQAIRYWPEVDLSLAVRRANLLIPSLSRVDSTQSNPQFVATGAVGTFNINRYWSVSAGYLFADLPQQNQIAHVPLVAFTPILTARHWTFPDVNRFERLVSYSSQPYRYRNRATADYAFGQSRTRHVYVSNEVFVNLSSRSWNQNRALVGVGIPVGRLTRMDAYLLQKSAPGGKEISAIGTVLTVTLSHRGVR